jgi:membrane carboxypeptidase/penicillin-binding protein
MQKAGFISASEAEQASRTPLGLAEQSAEARQQAYFVDMVKAQLLAQFSERDLLSRGYRIYTTLDIDLQRAASEGARAGLIEVGGVHCGYGAVPPSSGRTDGHSFGAAEPTQAGMSNSGHRREPSSPVPEPL